MNINKIFLRYSSSLKGKLKIKHICIQEEWETRRQLQVKTVCEGLARLSIPNKIPKCPLTQFSNSSSYHLTYED